MNTAVIETSSSRLSWRAIIAGAVVALSIHLLLTTLGAGISALVASPYHNDSPVQTMSMGLALSWTLSALISLWVGGYVAAKVGALGDPEDGKLHGFVMWSVATVLAFVMVAAGVSKALGAAGQAAAGVAKTAAEAAPTLAQKSGEVIDQYASEATPNGKALTPAGKREIALDLKNLLANGDAGRTPQNREALVNALAAQTGMSPADANKTVDEWTASYDRAVEEVKAQLAAAAKKAKEIADKTATVTGAAGIWTFIAFWIGAVAAAWGGKMGAVGCAKSDASGKTYTPARVRPAQV